MITVSTVRQGVERAQGMAGGSAPFGERFLLDFDPLLLKRCHGGLSASGQPQEMAACG